MDKERDRLTAGHMAALRRHQPRPTSGTYSACTHCGHAWEPGPISGCEDDVGAAEALGMTTIAEVRSFPADLGGVGHGRHSLRQAFIASRTASFAVSEAGWGRRVPSGTCRSFFVTGPFQAVVIWAPASVLAALRKST